MLVIGGDTSRIRYLLDRGCWEEKTDNEGVTVLAEAVMMDRYGTGGRASGPPATHSYGGALESAFREISGGRGATADAPSFLAFVREALAQFPDAAAREQLAPA